MTAPQEHAAVVLRLSITGELGAMDYPAVLRSLQASYELLNRTAHRVLGDRAEQLHWHLTGLRESSAMTLVRAMPTDTVTEHELRELVETCARDLGSPAERLPEDDIPKLREVLQDLQRTGSGGLLAEVVDRGDGRAGRTTITAGLERELARRRGPAHLQADRPEPHHRRDDRLQRSRAHLRSGPD